MSVNQTANQSAYGLSQGILNVPYFPIVSNRNPATTDRAAIGQQWINKSTNAAYVLTSIVANVSNWADITGGPGVFTNLVVTGFATIGTTLTVTGATTLNAALTVAGLTTLNGGIAAAGAGAIHLTTTDNVANAIELLTNGGTTETIQIINTQGTAAGSILVESLEGGVGITSGSAGASSLELENTNAAGGISLIAGTGGITATTGTGPINISNDDFDTTIIIGEGVADKNVTLGSTSSGSSLLLQSGTGGMYLAGGGIVNVVATTPTSGTSTNTSNVRVINATFTGFTTAMGASQAFTISSTEISTTSACLVTVTNLNASTNGAFLTVNGITQALHSLVVSTTNNGAGALGAGDNVLVSVWVLN